MESKSFGEKLEDILESYGLYCGDDCNSGGIDGLEAKQAIIDLVKELVPKEPFDMKYKDCPAAWIDSAYKQFRQAILDKLDPSTKV